MTRGLFVKIILCLITINLPAGHACSAENVWYVTDTHFFNLRSSIYEPYKIVGTVKSKDPLIVLKEQGKYVFVETSDGKKGWLGKRFAAKRHPESAQIEKYKKESEDLQASINLLETLLNKEKRRHGNLLTEEESKVFLNKNTELLRLNQELGEQLSKQHMEIVHLQSQLDFSRKQQQILWFMAGAAVLFAGILLGRWLNSKKRKYLY